MRVGHLSDLHLGKKSAWDQAGAERLNSLRQALSRLAAAEVAAILIAGDLFDSAAVDRGMVQEAAKAMQRPRLPNGAPLPVVVIPGNHDPASEASLWTAFQLALEPQSAVNLILIGQSLLLAEGRLLVEAYPCETRYSPEAPWSQPVPFPPGAEKAARIVLAHGTLQGGPVPEGESNAYPFTWEEVRDLGADYVALGHFHGLYPAWDGADESIRPVSYSGTHEPDQFGGDAGFALVVTLEKGQPARVQRLAVGKRRWQQLVIDGPGDLVQAEALRRQVEESEDPTRHVLRFKIGSATRLSPEEADKLTVIAEALQALGAHVERRGDLQAQVDVQDLDLELLPAGAVRAALLSLKEEWAQAGQEEQKALLAAALQIGWAKMSCVPFSPKES